MNSSGFLKLFRAAIIFGGIGLFLPALADDDHHCCVDWARLNLTSSQNTQVQQLEDEWARQYNEIRPVIIEDQQKLTKLLANHNSDPVEVMALQQAIARKKEQLNGYATINYLKKRQVLTDNQQFALEQQIKDAVRRRQTALYPGSHGGDVATDRIQNLLNRVRWPVQSER